MSKVITIFTEGDSSDSGIWSNIPYFFTKTLIEKGYFIHRINVEGNPFFKYLYDKLLCRILRHTILKKTSYSYERSRLYAWETNLRMRKAVKQHPDSDYYVSTSFSFSPTRYTSKPCILFCDWTYEYYIHHFLNKEPDYPERCAIQRQDNVIEHASYVFVLFPNVAEYMKQYYSNPHIFYLGNVINSDSETSKSCDVPICRIKQKNKKILFIGLKKYKEGAVALIHAISQLHTIDATISLDIIGMDISDFTFLPDFVRCHGYLKKNIGAEGDLYESLLKNATVYVNTTPKWAGFSSCLEALYHYTPIITTPYASFTDTFGTLIPFGYYCNENTSNAISSYLNTLFQLSTEQYTCMCMAAHESVKDFTWSSYVDKMLEQIKSEAFAP
ncbi:MAG: glycosyltransferase [Lachnospiraceae bacterium]